MLIIKLSTIEKKAKVLLDEIWGNDYNIVDILSHFSQREVFINEDDISA